MEEELSKRERKKLNREKGESEIEKSSIKNKLFVVGAIVAVAAGFFWLMYRGGNESASTPEPTQEATSPSEVSTKDHVKGPEEAVVTLVEYGDFQCPACASYQPVVDQLAEKFDSDLRVVYRHFPLRSIHKHAQISAQASEAAADQGYFWEMYAILYQRQDDWANTRDPRSLFREYADELTLNLEQFDEYMNSADAKAKVDADYESGNKAGINSTPTFFINGEKIGNPPGFEPFSQLIQEAIDKIKQENQENTEASPESSPEGEITPQL